MKIALVTEHFVPSKGGSEMYGLMVGRALIGAGHEVHVITRDWDPKETGFIYHRIPASPFKFFRRYGFVRRAARALTSESFDLVHAFTRGVGVDILQLHGGCHRKWLERELRIAESTTVRLLTRFKRLLSLDGHLVLKLEREQFSTGAPHIIAISEMVRDDLLDSYPVDPARVRVILNGLDVERFHPRIVGQQREAVRNELGLTDEVAFLFVGHNFKRKGLKPAIRAFARLGQAAVPHRLIVLGGDRKERYAGLARELHCESSVQYVGSSDRPERYYAAADAVVFPSYYDPFGYIVLEGLACGLPVITSKSTGACQLIESGKTGFVVDCEDVDALAAAMRVCLDAEARRRMGRAARIRAEECSLQSHVDELLSFYREVLAVKAAGGASPDAIGNHAN